MSANLLFRFLLLLGLLGAMYLLISCGSKCSSSTSSSSDSTLTNNGKPAGALTISNEQKFDEAISAEGLTLVDFYATWCGPCKVMHPVLDEISKECATDVRVIKVDVDAQGMLAGIYRIQSIPTLILFKNGEVIWRQSGLVSKGTLIELIETYK